MSKRTRIILIITSVVSGIVFILSLINKLIFLNTNRKYPTLDHNQNIFHWRYGKIKYTVHGKGKPLLLIHSLLNGSSKEEFNNLIDQLSINHKVYTIDLLGYGESEKPRITYTSYVYIQLISDFIKVIIKEPTDIISSGNSNSIITMAALQDNINIKDMIFINPGNLETMSLNPTKKDKSIKRIIELPLIGTLIYNMISSKRTFFINSKNNLKTNNKHINKSYIELHHANTHLNEGNHRFSFASNYFKFNNVNIKHTISTLDKSIYIIQGNYYINTINTIYDGYVTLNPSIERFIVNNSKNYPHITNPSSVIQIIDLILNV